MEGSRYGRKGYAYLTDWLSLPVVPLCHHAFLCVCLSLARIPHTVTATIAPVKKPAAWHSMSLNGLCIAFSKLANLGLLYRFVESWRWTLAFVTDKFRHRQRQSCTLDNYLYVCVWSTPATAGPGRCFRSKEEKHANENFNARLQTRCQCRKSGVKIFACMVFLCTENMSACKLQLFVLAVDYIAAMFFNFVAIRQEFV